MFVKRLSRFVGLAGVLVVGATLAASAGPALASVPKHVDTWAYDDGCNGGTGASSTLVRNWVTYAETNCGPNATKANTDCHASGKTYCTTLAYLDPNWQWSEDGATYGPFTTAASQAPNGETWYVHQAGYTDSAHRLDPVCGSYGTGYLADQLVPAVNDFFRDYARTNFSAWDGLMMDDTSGSLIAQLYNCGNPAYTTSEEYTSDKVVQQAHEQQANDMTTSSGASVFQVNNGISPNPYITSPWPLLDNPPAVHGFVSEGYPWDNGFSEWFSSLLDDMAYVDNNYPSGYFIAPLGYDSSGSPAGRRVQEATILLGFSAGHTVDWANLDTNSSDLSIWPEEGIYPTQPVQTMGSPGGPDCMNGDGGECTTGGHNGLLVATGPEGPDDLAPGVYRREFAACYFKGASTPFGQCAAIVNDTSAPVTVQASWLTQSYAHTIVFGKSDVQSGGSINVTGGSFTPGVTTIPADDALLISK